MGLTCQEVCRKIASEEYAEAGWWERWVLRLHLRQCLKCRVYEAQIGEIGLSARRRLRREEPVRDLERLAEQICRDLQSRSTEF